jgi:predicted Fe-Mo cluster-binding NifX family protein
MTTRILIPTEDQNGLTSQVSQHFGRAPYFAVVDFINGKFANIQTIANTGEHQGGSGHPHENLLALNPSAIIAHSMGPGGIQSFRKERVIVLKANSNTVKEIITAFEQGQLVELTDSCSHAHNHEHDCH